jgi:hypothetical protein
MKRLSEKQIRSIAPMPKDKSKKYLEAKVNKILLDIMIEENIHSDSDSNNDTLATIVLIEYLADQLRRNVQINILASKV